VTTSVHLVGSAALDTADDVFATAGRRRLRHGWQDAGIAAQAHSGWRGRRLWNAGQLPVLRANPSLVAEPLPGEVVAFVPLRLADGVVPEDVHFGELGYAREARASYQDFITARQRGDLAPSVRFQVCLPTPFAVISSFCTPATAQLICPCTPRP
jgi:hypothetical protein